MIVFRSKKSHPDKKNLKLCKTSSDDSPAKGHAETMHTAIPVTVQETKEEPRNIEKENMDIIHERDIFTLRRYGNETSEKNTKEASEQIEDDISLGHKQETSEQVEEKTTEQHKFKEETSKYRIENALDQFDKETELCDKKDKEIDKDKEFKEIDFQIAHTENYLETFNDKNGSCQKEDGLLQGKTNSIDSKKSDSKKSFWFTQIRNSNLQRILRYYKLV